MYIPVKKLFEEMGYSVNAEVADCDVTARSGDELIVIELKKNLSTTLLAQCVERQRTGAIVYAAVPKPKKYEPKKFRKTINLLKKLEVGLIFVSLLGEYSFAQIINEPEPFCGTHVSARKASAVRKEIDGRFMELNSGGITGRKIVTAYMERAIFIAVVLSRTESASVKEISAATGDKNAGAVLRGNVYKWFKKESRGVYSLTPAGYEGIKLYPELIGFFNKKIDSEAGDDKND